MSTQMMPQLRTNLQVAGRRLHEGKCFPEGSTELGQMSSKNGCLAQDLEAGREAGPGRQVEKEPSSRASSTWVIIPSEPRSLCPCERTAHWPSIPLLTW